MATRKPNVIKSKPVPHPNQPPVRFVGPRPGTVKKIRVGR